MKIGIISDSHDNIPNLKKALAILEKENCEELIHCGDFCDPFMIKELRENFKGKIHCVFGNTDDKFLSTKKAIELNINLYGDFAEIEIDNKKIAIIHSPAIAEAVALSDKYDLVCHGHDHKKRCESRGETLLVNPGEIAGIKNNPSIAIYDTEKNEIKHIELK